jgi:hypothetical protein
MRWMLAALYMAATGRGGGAEDVVMATSTVIPAKAGIQYAAALRLN